MGDETDPDMSAVRIDNNAAVPIIVNDVSIGCTGGPVDLGGPGATSPLAAGNTLIVVGATPLDGSDGPCSMSAPVSVTVTVNGLATTYADDKLNTALYPEGSAILGCLWQTVAACNGTEDAPWTQLGTAAAPASPTPSAAPSPSSALVLATAAASVTPSSSGAGLPATGTGLRKDSGIIAAVAATLGLAAIGVGMLAARRYLKGD
jgi:hypothetical protein